MAFGELPHRSVDNFDITQSRPLDSYMPLRSIFHVKHDVLESAHAPCICLEWDGLGWPHFDSLEISAEFDNFYVCSHRSKTITIQYTVYSID